MIIKSYKEGKVENHNNENILKDRNNIVIYKQDDNYIIRKDNIFNVDDYRDMMYRVYVSNRKNNNIYFVNMDDELVEYISEEGRKKREYVLPIHEIETNPFYEDFENTIAVKMSTNENVVDIEYSVITSTGEEESFTVKMDYIYDVELSYKDGNVVNTRYIDSIKEQLEDKFDTRIKLNNQTEKEKVYSM